MIVIGIVGGVASGKSVVARMFAEQGGTLIDGDEYGHQVLEDEGIKSALRERWGQDVFDGEGNVLRQQVGHRVFALTDTGKEDLAFLEGLSHPMIKRKIENRLQEISAGATDRMVILDAAVMLKAGWDKLCEKIVYVDVPREMRLDRAVARGWSPVQFDRKELSQRDLTEKRRVADYVVDNSGTREQTEAQVRQFVEVLFAQSP